jgi:His/Glu/Gln/Arg/opine family amino acid ABC transporter permease subunit
VNAELLLEYAPLVLAGFATTLGLAALVLAVAMPLALAVALCRHLRVPLAGAVCTGYVQTFRAVPALIVLYFAFYGLPRLGLALQPFPAAALAMTLTSVAYVSEDFRAALASVPRGQWDATHALGLPLGHAIRRIILPQALPVLVPPVMTNAIVTLKATSVASLVGVQELTGASVAAMSITFSATDFLVLAAVLYLGITGVLAGLQVVAERWVRQRYGTGP